MASAPASAQASTYASVPSISQRTVIDLTGSEHNPTESTVFFHPSLLIAVGLHDPSLDSAAPSSHDVLGDTSWMHSYIPERRKPPSKKRETKKNSKKSVPKKRKTEKPAQIECSICLCTIRKASATTTPCAHTFHRKCLDRWHNVRRASMAPPNCPYCKTNC